MSVVAIGGRRGSRRRPPALDRARRRCQPPRRAAARFDPTSTGRRRRPDGLYISTSPTEIDDLQDWMRTTACRTVVHMVPEPFSAPHQRPLDSLTDLFVWLPLVHVARRGVRADRPDGTLAPAAFALVHGVPRCRRAWEPRVEDMALMIVLRSRLWPRDRCTARHLAVVERTANPLHASSSRRDADRPFDRLPVPAGCCSASGRCRPPSPRSSMRSRRSYGSPR